MLLRASRASFAGLQVTDSCSVAGSGAQPLLDNDKDKPKPKTKNRNNNKKNKNKTKTKNRKKKNNTTRHTAPTVAPRALWPDHHYLTGAAPPNRPPSPIPWPIEPWTRGFVDPFPRRTVDLLTR